MRVNQAYGYVGCREWLSLRKLLIRDESSRRVSRAGSLLRE